MDTRINQCGRFWVQCEIEQMLPFILDGKHSKRTMLCRQRTNRTAFRYIAGRLTTAGFPRSSLQVRSKLKVMCLVFYKTLLHFGEHPGPSQMSPYFIKLKAIWEEAGRPLAKRAFLNGMYTFVVTATLITD